MFFTMDMVEYIPVLFFVGSSYHGSMGDFIITDKIGNSLYPEMNYVACSCKKLRAALINP